MTKKYFIRTKLAGVSFNQEVVKTLKEGQTLTMHEEKDNPVDKNAIVLKTEKGEKVGYIKKDLTKEIKDKSASNKAVIKNITGKDKGSLGVNIEIERLVKEGVL